MKCPIVCKLTDFGLSTSSEIQTNSFLQTSTECIGRGTPAYMAPEIMLEDLHFASQQDLMRADIWSLGTIDVRYDKPKSPASISRISASSDSFFLCFIVLIPIEVILT